MAEPAARPWRRALLRVAGLAVLALALAYLVEALGELDFARLMAAMGPRDWAVTGGCAVAYAAALGFLAQGWAVLAAVGRKLSPRATLAIYGPGAVAKYLPGSVLHYASRQVLGRRADLAHGAMAKASAIEAGLHVAVALALAGGLAAGGWWAVAVAAGLGAGLLAWRPTPLIAAMGCQGLFFAAYAALVMVLAATGALAADPARLAGLFFVAWTAGFLVPIAPGGIGVREAALLALAAPFETTDAIALVALLARLVGIVGDALFGLAGYFAATRLNRQASA